jgi:hypothetical protein
LTAVHPITALAHSIASSPGVYVPLIGSGMSAAAGVPTGERLTEMLARAVVRSEDGTSPEDVRQWWQENRGSPLTYQAIVEGAAHGPGDRQALLQGIIEPAKDELAQGLKAPTRAHESIADLVKRGFIRVMLTTNFDRLLEAALVQEAIEPQVITEPSDIESMVPLQHARCTLIKLHGDYLRANLLNTDDELSEYSHAWRQLLTRVLEEYGLFTVGWSGNNDHALRRAILESKYQYGRYFGVGLAQMHEELQQCATAGRAETFDLHDADRFFDQLGGAVDELARWDPAPLDMAALLGATKRLLAADHGAISLRDLLLREANLLRQRITEWWSNAISQPHDYRQAIDEVGAMAEPIVAAVACGAYLGSPENYHLWIETLRIVADQPLSMQGGVWSPELALRRLPAHLLFMGALLGSWKRGDPELLLALTREEIFHSYSHALKSDLQTVGPLPAPLAVALVAPEVVDAGAGMQLVAANLTYPILQRSIRDIYPVNLDMARDYGDVEYLLALLQYDWHARNERPTHDRWDYGSFDSGLLKLPGGFTAVRESASDRLKRRSGALGFDALAISGLFGHLPDHAIAARRKVDGQIYPSE